MFRNRIIIFFLLLLFAIQLKATHNRAGEITYIQISDLTYQIIITTFTNTRSTTSGWPPVDRPSLEIDFGDNITQMVPRTEMIDLPNYYRKNIYITTHTFPGPGTYTLVVEDPNRNEGIANIPNSVTVVFSIKTIMQINPTLGANSTPQLLSPPVDKAAKNRIFIHNPAAWDPDGDSLSYQLTPCTGEEGVPIPGFQFPDNIQINPITGDLIWNKPTETGAYNVAILIEEWRQGIKIGQITRDLQIEVYDTDNMPPEIISEQEICIEAKDSLIISLKVYDPDGDNVTLTPLGGAFEIEQPAELSIIGTNADTIFAQIKWQTNCEHIRRQPYLLVVKAEDDGTDISLADLHHIQVWVNGPAAQITQIEPTNNSISISWKNPNCNVSQFNLYRKSKSFLWNFNPCQTGLPAQSGYEKIASVNNQTFNFIDNNQGIGLPQGYQYCYRVVAVYNNAEGYASNEACSVLIRGLPAITNVSVEKTDSLNGRIYVAWSKPIDIDTVTNPGPYRYEVYRSNGIWGENFEESPVKVFSSLNDTIFLDTGLNTHHFAYSYKVELHTAQKLLIPPMYASSLWLETMGADNTIRLNVKNNVPWENQKYNFYLVNEGSEEHLAETDIPTYIHTNLVNGTTYTYRVESTGKYAESGFISPIINLSQQTLGMPVDTIPPNPPQLLLGADCDAFMNILKWNVANQEVIKVNLYYAPTVSQELTFIKSLPFPDSTQFFHYPQTSVSGCYAATTIDSSLNESTFSTKICIDSCDYYELPNVITINNDLKNDIFRPITTNEVIEKVIEEAHITIFNRWGSLVYETNDPLILWDGRDQQTNKKVSTGVYYYVCNLKERRISGIEERYKVGFVHVYLSK